MEEGKTVSEPRQRPTERKPQKHCSRDNKKSVVARIEAGELALEQAVELSNVNNVKIIKTWIATYGSGKLPVYKRSNREDPYKIEIRKKCGTKQQ